MQYLKKAEAEDETKLEKLQLKQHPIQHFLIKLDNNTTQDMQIMRILENQFIKMIFSISCCFLVIYLEILYLISVT